MVSPQFQVSGLITWQTSFTGDEDRAKTNFMAVQIFGIWQLGKGTYLRSSGISHFNLESGAYNIPFGMGVGKVIKADKLVFNIFAEPQLRYCMMEPVNHYFNSSLG